MPPKKKPRVPARVSVGDGAVGELSPAPAPQGTPAPATIAEPIYFDGWTDEQETTLFKAISIYRLKPAGMHKHFRIIGIAELMKNHGVWREDSSISGIWTKLRSLYALDSLDEREDMEDDIESPAPTQDFELPQEYARMMFDRRFDPRSADSPEAKTPPPLPASSRGRKASGMRGTRSVSAEGSRAEHGDDTQDENTSSRTASPATSKGRTRGVGRPTTVRGRARGGRTRGASTRSRGSSTGGGRGRGRGRAPGRGPGRPPKAKTVDETSEKKTSDEDDLSDVPEDGEDGDGEEDDDEEGEEGDNSEEEDAEEDSGKSVKEKKEETKEKEDNAGTKAVAAGADAETETENEVDGEEDSDGEEGDNDTEEGDEDGDSTEVERSPESSPQAERSSGRGRGRGRGRARGNVTGTRPARGRGSRGGRLKRPGRPAKSDSVRRSNRNK